MAKIYGTPVMAGGAGGANKDLPPLLDNFKAFEGGVVDDGLTRLKDLPSGSKVKLGKWNGTALQWKLARRAGDDQLIFLLEPDSMNVIGKMTYNVNQDDVGYPDPEYYPNNMAKSDIQQWLNATGEAGTWYVQPEGTSLKPEYADNKVGFLNQWTNQEINSILNQEWLSTGMNNSIDQSQTNINYTSKITLLTNEHLYNNDHTLDIFQNEQDQAVGEIYFVSDCWRSVFYANSIGVSGMSSGSVQPMNELSLIRPICAPNPEAVVSDEPDDDGCYTIDYNKIAVTIQADKMLESRANELAGAVWVYGDHEPENVNDGTKIQLSRDEVVAPALETLESGSKVRLGTYNGEPLGWIVARDTVTQEMRLVLDADSVATIGNMQWDAEEPSNPDSMRQHYGNNRYSLSNIHQWLNADGATRSWYTSTHQYDAAPDYATTKAGFLNEWTDSDRNVLQSMDWATTLSDTDGGGTENVSGKVALMSTTELGLESDTGGNQLDIFNSDGDRANGSAYWTRTPYPSNSNGVRLVLASGALDVNNYAIFAYGVRPICAPNPSTLISGPDSEGYYTIGGDAVVQKTVSWSNETDFFARQFTYNSKKQYQTMLEGAIATIVLTGIPAPVSYLAETHSGSTITLTWKNPVDDEFYDHTVVVYSTEGFPASASEGTQGYSGTDETCTLEGLDLGNTYYISVFTVSAEGTHGEGEQVSVEIPAGQLLSSLASGTKVKLGKWNNTDLQWKVARDTTDQSVRLVLEPTSVTALGNMQWDAPEPSNSDSNRRSYGNNRYIYSNIHQWLNATKATGWYTAQHSADAAPAYSSSAGFLSGWSENHLNALDRPTLTVSRSSTDGGGTETFAARVALMSTTELGLESGTGNGRLDIFNSDGDRATGSTYWTRTPYPSTSFRARSVHTSGALDYYYEANHAIRVRPLCSPKSTALVSLEMDDDNCYMVQ